MGKHVSVVTDGGSMTVTIRDGRYSDLQAITTMAEARRARDERFEPQFWKKKAALAAQLGRMFFAHLVNQPRTLCLVAELKREAAGFLIATTAPVPPVFDSGATAMIDDFCVASPGLWGSVGSALLKSAQTRLQEEGFSQLIVVCGFKDDEKTAFLKSQDLSLTSTWWRAGL